MGLQQSTFKHLRRRAAVVAFCMVGGLLTARPAGHAPAGAIALLEKYAEHRFDVVSSLVSADPDDADVFTLEIETKAQAWTLVKGPAEAPARRLLAATFVLDVARVWADERTGNALPSLALIVPSRLFGPPRWYYARRLIAWGCQLLRSAEPMLPDARLWFLASTALFEGLQDRELLVGSSRMIPVSGDTLRAELMNGHLAHARQQFPEEPRFRLAEAVAEENRTWNAGTAGFDPSVHPIGLVPGEITERYLLALTAAAKETPPKLAALQDLSFVQGLYAVSRSLEALANDPSVGAEVHLHYAFIALRFASFGAALTHARGAARSLDRDVRFVAELFSGLASEGLDQPADAIAAYRAALEIAPRARSASVLLTSLLLRSGGRAAASEAAEAYLSGPEPADPWKTYRTGDYRLFNGYLDQLRGVLK